MTSSQEILEELQAISPAIATIGRENVYTVPGDYFDGLSGAVMQLIHADEVGGSLTKTTTPFSVPNNYFETLSATILQKINAQPVNEVGNELEQVAPLLNTISKQMPYTVPAGYFEALTIDTSAVESIHRKPARVIGFNVKRLYKYAAAAVVTGIVAVSAFLLNPGENKIANQNTVSVPVNIAAAVRTVSEDDIVAYLEQNAPGVEITPLNTIVDEEIDVKGVIEGASDGEIKEYLKQFETINDEKVKDS